MFFVSLSCFQQKLGVHFLHGMSPTDPWGKAVSAEVTGHKEQSQVGEVLAPVGYTVLLATHQLLSHGEKEMNDRKRRGSSRSELLGEGTQLRTKWGSCERQQWRWPRRKEVKPSWRKASTLASQGAKGGCWSRNSGTGLTPGGRQRPGRQCNGHHKRHRLLRS